MTPQADVAAAPVRRSRRWWFVAVAAGVVAVVAVAAGVVAVVAVVAVAMRPAAPVSYPDVPGPGAAAPAVCPATWVDGWPTATRTGNLVPPGPVEALLCVYPNRGPDPSPLRDTHRRTDGLGEIVAYLNRRPTAMPADTQCLFGAATAYNLVFGYADRRPAVVHLSCAAEQSGAVRFEVGIQRVTGFWGVPWND